MTTPDRADGAELLALADELTPGTVLTIRQTDAIRKALRTAAQPAQLELADCAAAFADGDFAIIYTAEQETDIDRVQCQAISAALYATPAAKPQPATVTADAPALDLYYSDPENEGFEPDVQSADYREKYLRFANVFMSRFTITRKDGGR